MSAEGETVKATILVGHVLDRLAELPNESVQCVVTSPPYWGLRDYGVEGQLGLEKTPAEFLENMVKVFREVRRVLRSDGTCWVNMGDSYNGQNERAPSIAGNGHLSYRAGGANFNVRGLKPKDMIGMPWRLAFALQHDGWYLRQDIIWAKNNPMPESVSDRCTKSHEYIFLLSKSESYFFDAEAIKEKASTNSHSRGGGVNPKAKKSGQHSRMAVDRDPRHLKHGQRKDRKAHAGMPIQSGLAKLSNHHGGHVKQNESFSAAVTELVSHRNKRSVWTMATAPFKKAHFATFPPTLPRICIKAGTSAQGCCASCGKPFSRITERYDTGLRQKMADGWDVALGSHGTIHREGRTQGETDQPVISVRTIGWESGCCSLFGGGVVPCLVLDPFAGAGTTGLVSVEMGRNFVGIELNPEYAVLAKERIALAVPDALEIVDQPAHQ